MKIINIIEDTTNNDDLIAEHGLSFYIETEKHKILIDTGASEATWKNAEKLGVDLNLIDIVFLSHGHYDHCGGVLSFCGKNEKAKIYIHENAKFDFYNIKSGKEKYIGINKNILNLKQLNFINSDYIIDNELSAFTNVVDRINWPTSNYSLKRKINNELIQDDFSHEQYVVINSDNKLILISGCAHNGIINILNKFNKIYGKYPDIVLSGFHMNKNENFNEEDFKLIEETAEKLAIMKTEFFTGHCTGYPAFCILSRKMQNLHLLHSGFSCSF